MVICFGRLDLADWETARKVRKGGARSDLTLGERMRRREGGRGEGGKEMEDGEGVWANTWSERAGAGLERGKKRTKKIMEGGRSVSKTC